jgi:succinate-semialdehyde dehydrogenase/glutarate-semialdehyde dehydrogenase
MHKIASALAAGNCVILKPASDNPLTVMRMVGYMLQAGIPGYALQAVTGSGSKIGDLITEDDRINAVSFTGSTAVGQRIASRAAGKLKHLFLELGGNDPFIVFKDADMDAAVEAAASGRLQNAGQTCCSPKRFLVQKEIAEEFTGRLKDRISGIEIRDPEGSGSRVWLSDQPESSGRSRRTGTEKPYPRERKFCAAENGSGTAILSRPYSPALRKTMDISRDMEVFGPVFPIIAFDTEEDAIRISNNSCYGLNAGIMTADTAKAMRVASALECGSVVFNSSGNYRNIDQPHGGRKHTGLGREGISCTLEDMTETKAYIMKGILKK